MPDIFKVGIAKKVYSQMSKYLFPATLIKTQASNRGDLTGGTNPVTTEYQTTGFISTYRASHIDGSLIRVNDRKAILLGQPLPVAPEAGDSLILEGRQWYIVTVSRDPAGATYSCQVR